MAKEIKINEKQIEQVMKMYASMEKRADNAHKCGNDERERSYRGELVAVERVLDILGIDYA